MRNIPTEIRRLGNLSALAAAGVLVGAAPAAGRDTAPPLPPVVATSPETAGSLSHWRRGEGGVLVLDSLIAERVALLRAQAPSFELAWRALERSGYPLAIGSREQLEEVIPRHLRTGAGWAGLTLTWGNPDGGLRRAAVAIRTDWLRELHREHGNSDGTFLEALDELIVHEVYGHLAPVVEARSTAAACADPLPHERHADSCVGRRELAVRMERREVLAERAVGGQRPAVSLPVH